MEFIRRLESFFQLKNQLIDLQNETLIEQKKEASIRNPWFTMKNIDLAFQGIIHLLQEDKIRQWVHQYNFKNDLKKNVGVIAAGNIPMVGFHDVLCVLLSGHNLHIKLSHQDNVLLPFLFSLLEEIDSEWKNKIHVTEKLKDIDAIIATGSDNSARYFEYYFRHVPRLIRKNRTSIAVLKGNETKEELTALGSDIYQYFGFGCRNVAKLLLPEKYELPHLLDHFNQWSFLADHHKYVNNYNYHRAIFSLEKIAYLDNGFSIFTQNPNLVSPTTVIYFDTYENEEKVIQYISENEEKVQCVVGNKFSQIPGMIHFGKSQMPEVWDYADHVDTLKFLEQL